MTGRTYHVDVEPADGDGSDRHWRVVKAAKKPLGHLISYVATMEDIEAKLVAVGVRSFLIRRRK